MTTIVDVLAREILDSRGNPHISYVGCDLQGAAQGCRIALNHAWLVTQDMGGGWATASDGGTATSDEEHDGVSHSDPIDTELTVPPNINPSSF